MSLGATKSLLAMPKFVHRRKVTVKYDPSKYNFGDSDGEDKDGDKDRDGDEDGDDK